MGAVALQMTDATPLITVPARVSVVVLNWNGRQYLPRCLDSIAVQTYPDVEMIVMDNGSADGSGDYIREHYPAVVLVESRRNLGVPTGNNMAARRATGEYLFLINSDAWLTTPDVISRLVQTSERMPSAAIIGCYILNLDGTMQDIGEKIDALGFPGGIVPPSGQQPDVIDDVFYVCGCANFMRAALFWQLGAFDSRYFWSHEDVDLAWRARLYGYSVLTDMRAVVGHVGGGSMVGGAPGKEPRYRTTATRIYYRERSTLATLLKNYAGRSLARVLPLYVGINLLEMLFFLIQLKPSVSYQYLRAYWWNLRQLPATLQVRRRVQRERRVSDRDLARYFWPGIRKVDAIRLWGLPRVDV